MKIYFAGSIRGGRQDVELYSDIIKLLQRYGEVLTEHIADKSLLSEGEKNLSDREIHDRDVNWLKQSDVIVAEVTIPSLGVGYEIKTAIELNKQVLCLYRKQKGKRLSAMIGGAPGILISQYRSKEQVLNLIDEFFGKFNH